MTVTLNAYEISLFLKAITNAEFFTFTHNAQRYGIYYNQATGETKEEAQTQALRELIAHTAEATPTKSFLQKANDFLKAMVGALRAALRKMGLDLDISTSDVYKLNIVTGKQIGRAHV